MRQFLTCRGTRDRRPRPRVEVRAVWSQVQLPGGCPKEKRQQDRDRFLTFTKEQEEIPWLLLAREWRPHWPNPHALFPISSFTLGHTLYFYPDFVLPVRGPGAGGGENQQKGPAANHGRWADRINVTISVIKMKNHRHHPPMRVPFLASVKLSLAPPAPTQHLKPILFFY